MAPLDTSRQDRFDSTAHEAMVNVMLTNAWIAAGLADTMAEHELTPAQYNVLRILRGVSPRRVPCSYIAERLIDRTPDVTRLLDRLQNAGLVERNRAEHDRRVVEVAITPSGQARIEQLQGPVDRLVSGLFNGLDDHEQRLLSDLLQRMRAGAEPRNADVERQA